jgi:anaerobic selenocysteine-containing dehydrogenase
LASGDRARITTEVGQVEAAVEVTDGIKPGVVSLPHGWGHDRAGTRTSVASRRPGPNTNLLTPGHFLDVPSGNAAVNGVPVVVTSAHPAGQKNPGPLDPTPYPTGNTT